TFSSASPMRSILGQRVRDVAQAAGRTVKSGSIAMVHVLQASGFGQRAQSWRDGRGRAVVRALLLALPLLLIFGTLLSSADPLFGSLFSLPKIDIGEVMSHFFVAGVVAWVVGGWLYAAVL